MIHIFIGTKAQYVKTAPVIRALDRRGVEYNLIDSGQHAQLQERFRRFLDVRRPDVMLREGCGDITSPSVLMKWFAAEFLKVAVSPGKVRGSLFHNKGGICVVHGDTPTALLSALIARRCGLRVAHLEAGLRSFHLFDPFPEEAIRLMVMRISDILFTSSEWARDNLNRMRVKGIVVPIQANTGLDSVRYSLGKCPAGDLPDHDYCMVSIHRFERLFSKSRLLEVVDLVEGLAGTRKVLFPLHPPTKRFLKKYGCMDRLELAANVICSDLYEYGHFLNLIKRAEFIVTDGGSVQEEAHYFGVPCLVFRRHTERLDGLGENAVLAGRDTGALDAFLHDVARYRRDDITEGPAAPSEEVADYLMGGDSRNARAEEA